MDVLTLPAIESPTPTHYVPSTLMSRRASRYKSRVWVYASESEDPPTPPSLDCFDHDLRNTRRNLKGSRIRHQRQIRKGELQMLKKMPLDILYEVGLSYCLGSLPLTRCASRFLPISTLWMSFIWHEPHGGSGTSSCQIHLYASGSRPFPMSKVCPSARQT